MSNELTKLQESLGLVDTSNNDAVKALSNAGLLGGDYFPELRQVSSGDLVNKFNQKAGDFCVKQGESVTALGREIDIIPIAMRPKAIDFEEMVNSYNPQSPVFQSIYGRADKADSGCAVGTEFLIFVPALNVFACYFAGSKSARKASIVPAKNMGKVLHGTSYLAESGKYSWWAPKWTESDAEVITPAIEEARTALTKFNRETETSLKAEATAPVEGATASTGREV